MSPCTASPIVPCQPSIYIQVTSHGELSDYQISLCVNPNLTCSHAQCHIHSPVISLMLCTWSLRSKHCPQFSHIRVTSTHLCPSALPGDMMLPHRVLPSGSLPTASHSPAWIWCRPHPTPTQGHGLPLPLFRNWHLVWPRLEACCAGH